MKVENPVGDFPHPHSWRSDVRSGHLTMSCQLHSYLHGSITEPGGWACGNFLDLCRHLLGRLSVYSLAPSGNKGQDARGNRGVLSALNGIPAKRNANTRYYGLVSGCGAALGAIKFRLGSVQSFHLFVQLSQLIMRGRGASCTALSKSRCASVNFASRTFAPR